MLAGIALWGSTYKNIGVSRLKLRVAFCRRLRSCRREYCRGARSMPFFRDHELTVHYLERGRGEPLLLVHGLGSSGADWAFQVAALEQRFRIIVPDLPGSGHSLPPRNEYTIAGFAAALWKLMDHLRIERPNIVGFSLGVAVALEMATLR